jgi:uncharacterized protein (DUF2267 family)
MSMPQNGYNYTHKVRMKQNSMSERLEFIDHASQTAQKWIKDLAEDLQWVDGHKVFRLLRATLHAVRDWLQVNEAVQLGAQLPTLIRGVYYEGWKPHATPAKPRSRDAFLTRIGVEMSPEVVWALDDAVSTVFAFLSRHVSAGEIADVVAGMPADLQALWKR